MLALLLACTGPGPDDSAASSAPVWFETGQPAEVLLGAPGWDDAGGAQRFDRPRGLASDGTRLALADSASNRVLLWDSLPTTSATPPDRVLGQADFTGSDTRELAWPVAVAMGGDTLVVTDTDHDQLLVWHGWPSSDDQDPDLVLTGLAAGEELPDGAAADAFVWPWGVWTDGTRLVVSSTMFEASGGGGSGGWVLIWQAFPTESGQPADVVLTADGDMGTPRGISSDGTWLVVGDHNASGQGSEAGSWVWADWPAESETPPDAFVTEPGDGPHWLAGAGAPDGRALLAGDGLYGWSGAPTTAEPDLTLEAWAWGFKGGDGTAGAAAGDGVWLADTDANRVVGFEAWPTAEDDEPGVVLGALGLESDAVQAAGVIVNPTPVTDGEGLCVGDGTNLVLHCWEQLPTGAGSTPDVTVRVDDGVEALAWHGDTLVMAGPVRGLQAWRGVPLDGRGPDEAWGRTLDGVDVGMVAGLALDDRYLHVVDRAGWLHGFTGAAAGDPQHAYTVSIEGGGGLVYSDGQTLALSDSRQVTLYAVDELEGAASGTVLPAGDWSGSLGAVLVAEDRVFLVDQGAHRVYGWSSVDAATSGVEASVLLGASGWDDEAPARSDADLFWPRSLAFDGETLWVGEYKFGGRVLGFTGVPE